MRRQNSRRAILGILALVLVAVVIVLVQPVDAQSDGTSRRLTVGQAVTSTLGPDNFAETYIFDASTGNTANLTATTSAEGLSLALLLTGPDGEVIARDGDLSSATVAVLSNVALPLDGTYVVTVLRGTGAEGDAEGEYTLALAGTITPPATTTPNNGSTVSPTANGQFVFVNLEDGGIDISLEWTAAVDLNLEARDPIGGAIYGDNLTAVSGGVHAGDTNRDCTTATADNPTESINWPQGSVPVGSYEILIYYQQACGVDEPQNFTLIAGVNGDDPQTITGRINPGQVYLARVTVDLETTWELFNGGVNSNLDVSLDGEVIEAALGQSYTGTITNDNPKDVYTLEVAQGAQLTINLDATSGSLDTLLILLDANGQRLLDNDDRAQGITDSALQTTINVAGTYTIVTSRYGQIIGGTEGNYTLSINTGTPIATNNTPVPGAQTTPAITSNLNLPAGSVAVTLTWATDHDLQLLVRDPQGSSIYDDVTTVSSGGILGAVGNQGCNRATGTPTSYIYWPATRQAPTGVYEVEVWFQDDCEDLSLNNFELTVSVAGQELFASGLQSANINNRYMMTFTINPDTPPTHGTAGFFEMSQLASGGTELATILAGQVTPIEYDSTITGQIGPEQKYVVYSFEGRAGDRIGILMQRTSGTLDTAVYLIGPNNIQLNFSDDISVGSDTEARNTNSRITNFVLTTEGTYYIVASHYGLGYGGTIGGFSLSITQVNTP